MRLGELITALEQLDPSLSINGEDVGSYRGYYDQLAVVPGESTVGELLEACRGAVGATFRGYKGGEYVMNEHTPVWFSDWGDTSRLGVFGVTLTGQGAVLNTADMGDYGW